MSNFTLKQLKCIEHLAVGEMTQVSIAEELGVRPQTITKWKHKPGFMEAVIARSKEILKSSLPEVYKALADESKMGKDRHIKILLDHIEKLEEVQSARTSITFSWLPTTTTTGESNE